MSFLEISSIFEPQIFNKSVALIFYVLNTNIMAIIKPFKGIRPPQDLVEQVASRPYDCLLYTSCGC